MQKITLVNVVFFQLVSTTKVIFCMTGLATMASRDAARVVPFKGQFRWCQCWPQPAGEITGPFDQLKTRGGENEDNINKKIRSQKWRFENDLAQGHVHG